MEKRKKEKNDLFQFSITVVRPIVAREEDHSRETTRTMKQEETQLLRGIIGPLLLWRAALRSNSDAAFCVFAGTTDGQRRRRKKGARRRGGGGETGRKRVLRDHLTDDYSPSTAMTNLIDSWRLRVPHHHKREHKKEKGTEKKRRRKVDEYFYSTFDERM